MKAKELIQELNKVVEQEEVIDTVYLKFGWGDENTGMFDSKEIETWNDVPLKDLEKLIDKAKVKWSKYSLAEKAKIKPKDIMFNPLESRGYVKLAGPEISIPETEYKGREVDSVNIAIGLEADDKVLKKALDILGY